MDIALTILALLAGVLSLELFAAARAPLGYQDERGFHFGTPNNPGPKMGRIDIRRAPRIEVASALIVDTLVKADGPAGKRIKAAEKVPVTENLPIETATHA